jgi:integrase
MAPTIQRTRARTQLALLETLTLLQRRRGPHRGVSPRAPLSTSARVLSIDDLAHTSGHLECPACRALDAALQVERRNIAELTFTEACQYWSLRRLQSTGLRAGTHERDDAYLGALGRFFGPLRLFEVTPGHLRAYQLARARNRMRLDGADVRPWKRAATNSTINHELALLGRMLAHSRLWKHLRQFYFPLPVPKWSPREIMSEEEEAKFFLEGARHPQARLAYLVACLTNNTTASGSELRFLRLRHLFLRPAHEISEIYIPPEGVKNESRPRKIALNRTARWAVEQLYRRALELGSADPDDYLFPFWVHRGKYDPARPASKTFLRKSWARLIAAAGQPQLRPHDLRHNCITRLLEEGNDPETVRSIAGHLRPEMTEYYSHQRKRVKFRALRKIDRAHAGAPTKKPPRREAAPAREPASARQEEEGAP